MSEMTIVVHQREFVTRLPDPDGWDAGDTARTYDGIEVYYGSVSGRGWLSDHTSTIEVPFHAPPGSRVHVVLVQYSTGSTFGRRDGMIEILGAWQTDQEAMEVERLVNRATGFEYQEVAGQTFYTGAWIGYFERLEDVLVEPAVVLG